MPIVTTRGIVTGSTSRYFSRADMDSVVEADRDLYVSIWNFFSATLQEAGYAEIISYNYGLAATGMGYSNSATPAGENSFFVAKMLSAVSGNTSSARNNEDYYLMFQWAYVQDFGASPGNPGKLIDSTNSDGVGVQMAWRDDFGIPWMGSTNANGADRKGTVSGTGPVWGVSGTSEIYQAHVYPITNEPAGTNATNRENCIWITNWPSWTAGAWAYLDFVADADNVYVGLSSQNSTADLYGHYFGYFTPTEQISASCTDNHRNHFYATKVYGADLTTRTTLGSFPTYNNSATNQSIIGTLYPTGSARLMYDPEFSMMTEEPSNQTNNYELRRVAIAVNDSTFGSKGVLGFFPMLRSITDIAQLSYSTSSQLVVAGAAGTGGWKPCLPYSSTNVPRTLSDWDGDELRITGSWPQT